MHIRRHTWFLMAVSLKSTLFAAVASSPAPHLRSLNVTQLLPLSAQLVIPVAAPGEDQPQTVALPAYAGFSGNEKEELDHPHDFKASRIVMLTPSRAC